ncbi:fungal-specific transcription factor domain-containing protein [Dactylonectria estremocensis]|uniref:Fungal-specific transcription factor domain-containing protein n=1 Tax=Dactylonectria estremocensis TaxID=1079267 RepID=A0A9P9FFY4_9HYPO|nr:fungal-specific transcription factor domain-containing protein [Dactylonectria estremocensis]
MHGRDQNSTCAGCSTTIGTHRYERYFDLKVVTSQNVDMNIVDTRSGSPFVYGVTQTEPASLMVPNEAPVSSPEPPTSEPRVQQAQSTADSMNNEAEIRPPFTAMAPSFLPDLPPPYRSLLDYFTRVANSFSCNEVVKRDLYATFMPMATQKSHVMASMLSLAAIHRANAGLVQSPKQLALLQTVAVKQLRAKVSESSGYPTEDIMATVLMLCYSDIVAGGDKANSWRLHLEGAASLFARDVSSWTKNSPNSTRRFIARCFISLVALANVSGQPPREVVSNQALQMLDIGSHEFIDEFTAYSSELVDIFVQIGALIKNGCQISYQTGSRYSIHSHFESTRLIQQIRAMLDMEQKTLDTSALSASFSSIREEYLKINESYHQAALLHVYQRIQRLPAAADEIQDAVNRILTLVSGVRLLQGPCPGIVLLFPLFSAGCGAIKPDDRQQVRSLLQGMAKMFGINTVQQSLKVLEAIWSHRDVNGDSESSPVWETLVGKKHDPLLLRGK